MEWDAEKYAQNRRKHGVGLGDARFLDWEERRDVADTRRAYGEDRVVAYCYIGDRLYACVYTIRNDAVRIISLRKANKRETRDYGSETENTSD
jgi:uncharacterized protein